MPLSRSKNRAKTPSSSGRKKATSTPDIQKQRTTRIYDGNGIMTWVHYLLGHDKPLLSKHGAESLILWSYTSSPDPSKLAPILYPFWVKFAYFFPSWWSPNLVTVSGFFTVPSCPKAMWWRNWLDDSERCFGRSTRMVVPSSRNSLVAVPNRRRR